MITDWSKGSDLAKGLALGALSGVLAMNKASKVVNDTSMWILRKAGASPGAERFLDKAMSVAAWKQLSEERKTIYCRKCGTQNSGAHKFCTKCGDKLG